MSSVARKLCKTGELSDGTPVHEWLTDEERVQRGLLKAAPVGPGSSVGYAEGKPGFSNTMGCHKSQVSLMNREFADIPGIEWLPNGRCKITSRRARAMAMKRYGEMHNLGPLHDEDGGYGDG